MMHLQVDDKGKTTTLTKEQVVRGKRLFIASCASCHVGGGTRTNQNVGLAIEELSGATPNRATIEGLVDYLNNPTTYDGLKAWQGTVALVRPCEERFQSGAIPLYVRRMIA